MTRADRSSSAGFVPPPYPYERIDRFRPLGLRFAGGMIDFSIGTPCDPPPAAVIEALSRSHAERGYPPSVGTAAFRHSAAAWMERRFAIEVDPAAIGACVGTKEFVGTAPQWLRLRDPSRDTVLFPEISYPTYAMGATLAGCRPVPVPMSPTGGLRLAEVADADIERALMVWVNSPGNPNGVCDDLGAIAAWGRTHRVPVFSDECYVEFTWSDRGRTILEHGSDGVVALHSLSKRSNAAGLRAGFYAGDPELVHYLHEVRKHVGLMVPGPTQAAAAVALDDDVHVAEQRVVYRRRLERLADVVAHWAGVEAAVPDGGFYLWLDVGDAWEFTERLATEGGALVSPGDFYGASASRFVRFAAVQPDDRIDLLAARLGQPGSTKSDVLA